MILDRATWNEFFNGYSISDGVLSSGTRFWFLVVEESEEPDDDSLPLRRFVSVDSKLPMAQRCNFTEYDHLKTTRIGFRDDSEKEMIGVDIAGNVFAYNGRGRGLEDEIDNQYPDSQYRWSPVRLVRAGGAFYIVGTGRRIVRRLGVNQWAAPEPIPAPESMVKSGLGIFDYGFEDLAAFDANDMYAVGGHGDVWHFDGRRWHQLPFPSNDWLFTVCCAGDGQVYISGKGGSLWVGRGNKWKPLLKEQFSIPFRDTVWFAGRLWCGNEYGLWSLQDGKLVPLLDEQPAEIAANCGRLDVNPDGRFMLSMSPVGATLFDGSTWQVLFSRFQLE
ncbi:hypothetical protein [Chitinimonas lacunae]|uniref:Uncharacterized protein n=1 Tax=Chitinimonas lacunae TaxID=1963018 RepID=A0ABV8MTU6_9NEIS